MKLCMVGTRGHFGYVFAALEQLPEIKLVGICAGTPQGDIAPLRSACETIGISAREYDCFLTMLDKERPDMLCLSGPFEKHAEMCMEAFRREIHVFCEKPVAMNLGELEEMEAIYSSLQNKPHFAAMFALRFEPAFMAAWRGVRDGTVGRVRLIDARKSYKLGTRPDYYRRRETFGGIIPWVGAHAIDWIYWLANSPFRSVYATHSCLENGGYDELESCAVCMFTLENGVSASATFDFYRPAGAPTHGDDRVRVVGTKGIIEVMKGKAVLLDDSGERELPLPEKQHIFADFAGHVLHGTPTGIDADDTFAVTRACLLAREAADSGEVRSFGP